MSSPNLEPSPAGRLRASGVVFPVDPFARSYLCEKILTSEPSRKSGEKLMSSATVFCQISMVSDFPLSESWYWYWNGSPDGTCMSAVQAYWAKVPEPNGSPFMR